jgi:hypothetical protein
MSMIVKSEDHKVNKALLIDLHLPELTNRIKDNHLTLITLQS